MQGHNKVHGENVLCKLSEANDRVEDLESITFMSSNLIRFGIFEVYVRAARTRNPHTGEEKLIAASEVYCF